MRGNILRNRKSRDERLLGSTHLSGNGIARDGASLLEDAKACF